MEIAIVEAAAIAVNLTVFFKISSRGSLKAEGLSVHNLLNESRVVTTKQRDFAACISSSS